MGLPSGTLWAKVNIDLSKPNKSADSPFSDSCSYFSWGNTEGYNPINDVFDYNWTEEAYSSTPGAQVSGSIPLDHDAAHIIWGLPWRMPSAQDFRELLSNTVFVMADGTTEIPSNVSDKKVTVNGKSGIYLKSKINGNLLFFGAQGHASDTTVHVKSFVRYWARVQNSEANAYMLNGTSQSTSVYNFEKFHGLPIRPVI